MKKRLKLYTDGACSRNPGPGGWAFLLSYGDASLEDSGSEASTTNNRMEMTAAIRGLERLKFPCQVTVYSDSKYLVDGATRWLAGWKRSDFKGGTVKNIDLWKRLDELMRVHDVRWEWVRGHAGHPQNERVDRLAHAASQGERAKLA